jgi:hypothetical protein
MPMNVTPGTGTTTQPIDSGIIPTNPTVLPDSALVKPGYNADGAPLGDAEVWNLFVGKGRSQRPVVTAALQGKKAIDSAEAKALLELAQKDPKEFARKSSRFDCSPILRTARRSSSSSRSCSRASALRVSTSARSTAI